MSYIYTIKHCLTDVKELSLDITSGDALTTARVVVDDFAFTRRAVGKNTRFCSTALRHFTDTRFTRVFRGYHNICRVPMIID